MAKKRTRAGGRQPLGRPPGPPEKVRRNKVFAMLTDSEMEKLERLAEEQELPLSTAVYEILARFLKRRK